MRTGRWISVVVLSAATVSMPGACLAQSGQTVLPDSSVDSLALAARHAREAKRTEVKSAAVFTNDNLPTTGTISVVGQASTPATPAAADKPADQKAAPASAAAAKDAPSPEALGAAKENLANLKKDLDILQRTYTLDQKTYLSNPNHASDSAGAAKLQDERNQIDAKQQAVDTAQIELDVLTAKSTTPAVTTPETAPASAPTSSASDSTDSSAASKPVITPKPF